MPETKESLMECEIGKVVATRSGRAKVEVRQSSICSHCELSSSCVYGTGGTRVVEVRDPLGVSAGQMVKIEFTGRGIVGASFLAYILPLLTLFGGAAVGFYLVGGSPSELWAGLGAAIGLAVGLIMSRLAGESLGRRGRLTPAITAIVISEDRKEHEHAD